MTKSRTQGAASAPAYLALGCVGFLAAPAMAQDTSAPAAPRLGGVTVTDTAISEDSYHVEEANSPKYTAPLLDTPRTVFVIPSQVIQDSGSATFVDALRTVPGITFGAGEGGNPQGDRPFIRGSDAQGSTYIDGIRSVGGQSREIFAIEQIEVVKGGDSAMGGRGSAGGSLNLVSRLPHLGNDARADLSYGTDDYKRVTLDANYQIGSTAAFRMNAMWHDADVAGRDVVTYNRWGISPSIALGLGTSTRAYLNYYHLESNDIPDPGIPFERTAAQAAAAGTNHIGPAEVVNGKAIDRSTFYGLTNRDFRRTNVDEIMFRAEHDLNDTLRLRATAKYANVRQSYILTQPDDSQGNVQNGLVWRRANSRYSNVDSMVGQLDLAGTFNTGSVEHSIAAGFEGSWERSARGAYNVGTNVVRTSAGAADATKRCAAANIAAFNCTSLYNPNPNDAWVNYATNASGPAPITKTGITGITEARTYSLYAFDTIKFTDALMLNLGARYDWYHTDSDTIVPSTTTAAGSRTRLSLKDGFFNWQAGLVFKPTENGSFYVSYARSTTPPGSMIGEGQEGNALTNTALITLNDLKAEETSSYEIGTKWALFDEALSLNFALFRTDTANARTTNAAGLLEYVGSRRIDGFEIGFSGKPLPFWNIFGGYTYMDSEIRDAGPNNVANGRIFPNTPKHNFTAWSTFDIAERFQLGGGAIYMSRQYGSFSTSTIGVIARSIPSYWRFDAMASANINDHLALRVNVQNLTNKRYYDRTYTTHFATEAAGRSAFATLTLKY